MEETDYLNDEVHDAPFDADEVAADVEAVTVDEQKLLEESQPFFGRWYRLVSSTNWEKGRIIQQWRDTLIAAGAPSSLYSDEAWSKQVGGVTAPHAGRLRRVFSRFGGTYESYPGLYWSHFLAALEWDDAEMWLEGAMRTGWTVDRMRQTRWESSGAPAAEKPNLGELQNTEFEEDLVEPAQGGGSSKRERSEEDDPDRISSGPLAEDPDFGDGLPTPNGSTDQPKDEREKVELARPFEGLPELPADLGEALEMFKLAILRHKAANWVDVALPDVLLALDGLRLLAQQPAA